MNKQDYISGKESKKFDLKKPSKKVAFEIIEKLNNELLEDFPDGHKIGMYTADLERFFAPKETSKAVAQDHVKWCLQAVSPKKDNKLSIQTAYIDGDCSTCVASDGGRLHSFLNYTSNNSGGILPNGVVIKEEERQDVFGTFPSYKQVIPHNSPKRDGIVWQKGPIIKNEHTIETEIDGQKTRLNERYYKEAVAGMEAPEFFMFDYLSPLLIKDCSTKRLAVIMSILAE